jgi:hypothetical protein
MGAQCRIDPLVHRRRHVVGEGDLAPTADAVAERAQAVSRDRAVALEAAAFAPGCRLAAVVQRAVKVPSRCSSAFEVFCAAGSELESVAPGTVA